MENPRTLLPLDPEFPARLRALAKPPEVVTLSAPLAPPAPVVAVVGSRKATDAALLYARDLAEQLARAGAIVASGGALGIDRAAHEGALRGGRTWAVVPAGAPRLTPVHKDGLYERILAARGSAVIWPFPPAEEGAHHRSLPYSDRNRFLAALADVVVVIQAELKSGTLNTVRWARQLGRPLWVVPTAPWDPSAETHPGCSLELAEGGVHALTSTRALLDALGLASAVPSAGPSNDFCPPAAEGRSTLRLAAPQRPLTDAESRVFRALSTDPKHLDEVTAKVGLDAPAVSSALLTLALEDVVVEGPGGFFRRVTAL